MGKKLDSILAKVQKDYKVNISSARESGVIERLQLDSPGMNYCFGGGMPLGRIIMLHGEESSGKSTISEWLATQVQKKYDGKNTVVYLDYEYTFDSAHAEELGLDLDNNFILVRPTNGEDGFNLVRDLVDTGEVGLVVIDSITAVASKASCEDAFSGFAGGKNAGMISSALKMLAPYLYNNKCTMILIAQERDNIGAMYGPNFKVGTSRAPKFYSSWTARVSRTGDITDKDKGLIGIEMRVRNTKNKVGIAKRDANMTLYFAEGFRVDDEYVDYLKALGLVEQKGAYYSNSEWIADDGTVGMKVCGLEAVKDWLHANPKMYEKIKQQVTELICGHTILDNNNEDGDEETTVLEDGTVINSDGEIVEE